MRLFFVLFFQLIVFCSVSRLEAASCRAYLLKVVSGAALFGGLAGELQADLIQTKQAALVRDDLWQATQPYQNRMGFIRTNEEWATPVQIVDYARDQMDLFADHYFHLSLDEKNDPGFFRSDLFYERFEKGSSGDIEAGVWTQVSGEWRSRSIWSQNGDLPFYGFGSRVIYDETPNTPGLYQFWVVDFSGWPFSITHKHYAWIVRDPLQDFVYENEFRGQENFRYSSDPIPSPGTLIPFGLMAIQTFKRKR